MLFKKTFFVLPLFISCVLSQEHEKEPPKSILKNSYQGEVLCPELFTPIIEQKILQRFNTSNPYEFCANFNILTQNRRKQSTIPIHVTQEVAFWRLLNWSRSFSKLTQNTPDLINPTIGYQSYKNFYQPIGELLRNGFRKHHPLQPFLLESCLDSLKVMQSLWSKHRSFKKQYLNKKIGITEANQTISQKFLPYISNLINDLAKNSKPITHVAPKIRIIDNPSNERFIPPHLLMPVDVNRRIRRYIQEQVRRISAASLQRSLSRPYSKAELLIEMEKWDQFIDLLYDFATEINKDQRLPLEDIPGILDDYGNILNIGNKILSYYPQYTEENSEQFLIVELINQLSDFAFHFLDLNNIGTNFKTLFSTIEQFGVILTTAHQRRAERNLLHTSTILVNEITKLYYLFWFIIEAAPDKTKSISSMLEEMDFWRKQFDNAIEALNFPEDTFSSFNEEIAMQIRDQIFKFIDEINLTYITPNIEDETGTLSDATIEDEDESDADTTNPPDTLSYRKRPRSFETDIDQEFRHYTEQPV